MIGYSDWRDIFYGFLFVLPFLMMGFTFFGVIWSIFWTEEIEDMEVLKKRKHQQSKIMDLEKQAITIVTIVKRASSFKRKPESTNNLNIKYIYQNSN